MADSAKHVFISYVKEDGAHVDRLCRVLEAAQIPYWRDRISLGPGDSWKLKIREAIQGDALVFLGCFSDQSRARDKSYMNEELTLAADEFRLRPPGSPWLIPVRFDEGSLPSWDLGAGRTLNDLNRVDLFGESYAEATASLVTAIHRLLGQTTADEATTIASIQNLTAGERPAQMRHLTKEMLLDPSRRIALDDLVTQEVTRIIEAMGDEEQFPLSLTNANGAAAVAEVAGRAGQYWTLVEPFCWSLQVAARWAEPTALAPWIAGLRRLHSEASRLQGGNVALLELRHLPLLCATFTVALASVGQERWDNLRSLLVTNTVPHKYLDSVVPLLSASHPYRPFEGPDLIPHVLARSAIHDEDPADALSVFERRGVGRYHTPVAEWLHHILRPVFDEQLPDHATFDYQFDRAEVVLGLVEQDQLNMTSEGHRGRWFGRSAWRASMYKNPIKDLAAQSTLEGASWGPLAAGLFGGTEPRFSEAMSAYGGAFEQLMGRYH